MKSLITLVCFLPFLLAAPAEEKRAVGPTVQLTNAKVIGATNILNGIDSFKGIPYAQPPVGPLRLKPPQPITQNLGTVTATGIPRACPQFLTSTYSSSIPFDVLTEVQNTGFFQAISNAGEDCLTVNVQRPSTAKAGDKLPVVYWMFGGGFEFGSTQTYDGSELVSTSVAQKKDIIYVSVNYRIGGFGFLGGSEIKKDGAANLGFLDQRLGLEWVADNIAQVSKARSRIVDDHFPAHNGRQSLTKTSSEGIQTKSRSGASPQAVSQSSGRWPFTVATTPIKTSPSSEAL